MKRIGMGFGLAIVFSFMAFVVVSGENEETPWRIDTTIIEACSCPMFCQCYFNAEPAGHAASEHAGHAGHGGDTEHYCRFNNAFMVSKGKYGDVKLDGVKFWLSGDLGDEFSDGEFEWAVLTFDKAVTPEQREAIQTIAPQLYPGAWKSFSVTEGDIAWSHDKDSAHATIDGGESAEVKLRRFPGMTDKPVVINNLKYWASPRNDGFVLMPNEVQGYRVGDKAFETRGTNGFMITLHATSDTVGM